MHGIESEIHVCGICCNSQSCNFVLDDAWSVQFKLKKMAETAAKHLLKRRMCRINTWFVRVRHRLAACVLGTGSGGMIAVIYCGDIAGLFQPHMNVIPTSMTCHVLFITTFPTRTLTGSPVSSHIGAAPAQSGGFSFRGLSKPKHNTSCANKFACATAAWHRRAMVVLTSKLRPNDFEIDPFVNKTIKKQLCAYKHINEQTHKG